MSETEIVHFSIDGEWLTEHVRSLWAREDRPDHALKTLVEGLEGMTEEIAVTILDGRFKLVGSSRDEGGVRLVPDDSGEKLPTMGEMLLRIKEQRDEARDEAADLTELVIGDTVGLGSPGGLRHVPRRKTTLHTRLGRTTPSLKDGYVWPDTDPRDLKGKRKDAKPVRIYRGSSRDEFLGGETKEALVPEPVKVEPEPKFGLAPEAEDTICSDWGWLSPEGKYYPCSYGEHIITARRLGSEEPEIEKLGWVKIGQYLDGKQHIFGFLLSTCMARPTDIQKRMVIDYCLTGKREIPEWAKDGGDDA